MTKIEEFKFIENDVKILHDWEAPCYWCGEIFKKRYGRTKNWRIHDNIEHGKRIFCSEECKLQWIYAKQTFGELMP